MTPADASVLLAWRNDPSVREFSLNPAQITALEHSRWFTARLEKQKSEPFLFFEVDGKTIGMTRLDMASESTNKFEISILVDPNYHGSGIGTKILSMTCETFFGLFPEKTIIAMVHQQNLISQKLFRNAGFEQKFEDGNFHGYEKLP